LIVCETDRTIAVREGELMPARARLEARESRRFAARDAPEEGFHREIEPVQCRVFAFAMDGCNALVLGAQRR
jgi:hypothetical protein